MQVTGHPIVHLWVSSSAEDGDFFVYLEVVDRGGYSHYISEGKLRASHRALHEPPFENMALPWHRVRITVTGADADTFETPQLDPPPTISIYRNLEHPSFVELPVIPQKGR